MNDEVVQEVADLIWHEKYAPTTFFVGIIRIVVNVNNIT